MTSPEPGVWVVWCWSDGRSVLAIHHDERAALRLAVDDFSGYMANVTWVEDGARLNDVLK